MGGGRSRDSGCIRGMGCRRVGVPGAVVVIGIVVVEVVSGTLGDPALSPDLISNSMSPSISSALPHTSGSLGYVTNCGGLVVLGLLGGGWTGS